MHSLTVSIRRAALVFGLVPSFAGAQVSRAAPNTTSAVLFTGRDGLIGLAALGAAIGISAFDPKISRWFGDTTLAHVQRGQELDDTFTHINETTLTFAGLFAYGVGRATRSTTVTDIALHTTEAIVGASLTAQVIRGPLGRSRPRVTNFDDQYDFHWFGGFGNFKYRAFPSIHSSSGFAAAAALVSETQRRRPGATWVVAPVAYGLALTPGLARMYLGQHWASDVFAGAFLGTFAGIKAVGYSHDHPSNRFDRLMVPGAKNLNLGLSGQMLTVNWKVDGPRFSDRR